MDNLLQSLHLPFRTHPSQSIPTPDWPPDTQPDIGMMPEEGFVAPPALDELNDPESKALLDTIDKLRALGVGDIIDLPQIIVVGDQSSGKSSVLEAISHVRFPVKGGVCTRFATELVLRTAPTASVVVNIRYADDGSGRHGLPFRKTSFDKNDLPALIEEAKAVMGIGANGSRGAKSFSNDVLRVSITGPDVLSLTMVDLPGFFHSETSEQTSEDKRIVDRLVRTYMKQEKSIILAVLSANQQPANQSILTISKEEDPRRERTIGVITKPDLAEEGSANEQAYLRFARNQEPTHQLKLGWHVLRNRKESEAGMGYGERDAQEAEFLRRGAWSDLQARDKGVAALRRKLRKILLDHIRETLPSLMTDLQANLEKRELALKQLGTPRSTVEDMRSYLISIATEFRDLATRATEGTYTDEFFGGLGDTQWKLRAKIQNLHHAFAHTLSTKGASQRIVRGEDDDDDEEEEEDEDDPFTVGKSTRAPPAYLGPLLRQYDFPGPARISFEEKTEQLAELAAGNRGKEFPGMPNHNLVMQLFCEQARPWTAIADRHLDLVLDAAADVVRAILEHVVGPDDATKAALLGAVVEPFFDGRHEALKAKLGEIARPYVRGYGLPLLADYHAQMLVTLTGRWTALIEAHVEDEAVPGSAKVKPRSKEAMVRSIVGVISDGLLGNEFGTEKIIDMMETYYDMSQRTFVDNIVNLAVESCLMTQLPGILTPTMISRLDDEGIRSLAAESEDSRAERERLVGVTHTLREGLKLCRKYKPYARPPRTPPSSGTTTQAARGSNPTRSSNSNSNSSSPASPSLTCTDSATTVADSRPVTPNSELLGSDRVAGSRRGFIVTPSASPGGAGRYTTEYGSPMRSPRVVVSPAQAKTCADADALVPLFARLSTRSDPLPRGVAA